MVKLSLQIKATLENITEFYTNHPDYTFMLKLKCINCAETDDKWHTVTESETFPTKTGRAEVHYFEKCKFCGRENSLDIIKDSNASYKSEDQVERFKSIVSFDCRGIEPIDFAPGEGWIAKNEESGKILEDVDLSEKEWVDFDDVIKQPVGIYDFQYQFIKVK